MIILITVILCAVLQLTVVNIFNLSSLTADLFLILAIILALNLRLAPALISVGVLGALKDALSPFAFGLNTTLFMLLVLAIDRLMRQIYTENIQKILLISCVGIATIMEALLARAWIISPGNVRLGVFLGRLILILIYNLSVSLILYPLVKQCVRKYCRQQ